MTEKGTVGFEKCYSQLHKLFFLSWHWMIYKNSCYAKYDEDKSIWDSTNILYLCASMCSYKRSHRSSPYCYCVGGDFSNHFDSKLVLMETNTWTSQYICQARCLLPHDFSDTLDSRSDSCHGISHAFYTSILCFIFKKDGFRRCFNF